MKTNRTPAKAEDGAINAREAAHLVGVTDEWIRELTRRGEFVTPVRIGRRQLRFLRADVVAWIESRKVA